MENNEKAYYEKVDIDNELKLRKQLAALPPYCKQYFIAIESKTQSRTRLAYAYDLSCFFDYLHENNPICKKMSITEIPLSILESLKPMDLEEYLYNLKVYEKDGMAHTNEERGIKRKLSSLRSSLVCAIPSFSYTFKLYRYSSRSMGFRLSRMLRGISVMLIFLQIGLFSCR
jgi:hypothetical protein